MLPRDTQMDRLNLEEAQNIRPLDRAFYLVDLGIGVFFTIIIAVVVSSQEDALSDGEYSGNAIFFMYIWGPLFIVSLLSHLFLHGSPGQYFCKWKVQGIDEKPPGIGQLILATILRQAPGVFMVGTDYIVSATTGLSITFSLLVGILVGMFVWFISLDFSLPYRLSGLAIVDKVKAAS